MEKVRIYVDMDGTIADIHGEDNWFERVKVEDDFFQKLNPFYNLIISLQLIKYQYGESIEICTISSVEEELKETSIKSKSLWLDTHAGFVDRRIFSRCGRKKTDFVGELSKRDILLDDFTDNLLDWVTNGGSAIKVKNNINCSGSRWNGDVIYNQDSISAIVTKIDELIVKYGKE